MRQEPWIDNKREVWDGKTEYWPVNNSYGMCNTGSGKRITCMFGGINCDVDHQFVYIRNLLWRIKNDQ